MFTANFPTGSTSDMTASPAFTAGMGDRPTTSCQLTVTSFLSPGYWKELEAVNRGRNPWLPVGGHFIGWRFQEHRGPLQRRQSAWWRLARRVLVCRLRSSLWGILHIWLIKSGRTPHPSTSDTSETHNIKQVTNYFCNLISTMRCLQALHSVNQGSYASWKVLEFR